MARNVVVRIILLHWQSRIRLSRAPPEPIYRLHYLDNDDEATKWMLQVMMVEMMKQHYWCYWQCLKCDTDDDDGNVDNDDKAAIVCCKKCFKLSWCWHFDWWCCLESGWWGCWWPGKGSTTPGAKAPCCADSRDWTLLSSIKTILDLGPSIKPSFKVDLTSLWVGALSSF